MLGLSNGKIEEPKRHAVNQLRKRQQPCCFSQHHDCSNGGTLSSVQKSMVLHSLTCKLPIIWIMTTCFYMATLQFVKPAEYRSVCVHGVLADSFDSIRWAMDNIVDTLYKSFAFRK